MSDGNRVNAIINAALSEMSIQPNPGEPREHFLRRVPPPNFPVDAGTETLPDGTPKYRYVRNRGHYNSIVNNENCAPFCRDCASARGVARSPVVINHVIDAHSVKVEVSCRLDYEYRKKINALPQEKRIQMFQDMRMRLKRSIETDVDLIHAQHILAQL